MVLSYPNTHKQFHIVLKAISYEKIELTNLLEKFTWKVWWQNWIMNTFGILMIWAGIKSDSWKTERLNFYRHLFRNQTELLHANFRPSRYRRGRDFRMKFLHFCQNFISLSPKYGVAIGEGVGFEISGCVQIYQI